jgi:hypothetical protein
MTSAVPMRRVALSVVAAAVLVAGAAAADIQGYVGEQFGTKPQNALPTVKVFLVPVAGIVARPPKVDSDATGEYQHKSVPKGKYRLVFKKVGYLTYDRLVEMKAQNLMVADVFLWQDKLAAGYLGAVANRYASLAKEKVTDPHHRKAVYTGLWSNMRVVNVPPEPKKVLVGFVCEKDGAAPEAFEPFQQYQRAEMAAIQGLKATFAKALKGTADIPSRDTVTRSGLGPEVVTDIVLDALRATPPSAQKARFLGQFQASWGKDKSAQAVMHWNTQDEWKAHHLPR